ncbi:hypothetical protein [Microbispora sp. GKU 823]|uniref:hypothetical protein n=1 Tax=Microbispora sp. GKU 823 TaxID=1652100 RepID=UPI001C4DFA64|nr:hypothetical protein [Microbispora sp. GKU 823]
MTQPGDYGLPGSLNRALSEVAAERAAQDAMWGLQEHPDGTGPAYASEADLAKQAVTDAAAEGRLTWRHILYEEVLEAFAEDDADRLRCELIQVAAVAVKWVQALDRRAQSPGSSHTAPIGEVTSPQPGTTALRDATEPDQLQRARTTRPYLKIRGTDGTLVLPGPNFRHGVVRFRTVGFGAQRQVDAERQAAALGGHQVGLHHVGFHLGAGGVTGRRRPP